MQTETDLKGVNTPNVPLQDLELVKRSAIRNGHTGSDASAVRFAIVELAKRLRQEEPDNGHPSHPG